MAVGGNRLVDLGRNEVGQMKIINAMIRENAGRKSKYNFIEYADGRPRECDTQEDFAVTPARFNSESGRCDEYAS